MSFNKEDKQYGFTFEKKYRELKGWWSCAACRQKFKFDEFVDVDEEIDGNFPRCPFCGIQARDRSEPVSPSDYISVGMRIHQIGCRRCGECESGYPRRCVCGGLIHASGGSVKCDRCLSLYGEVENE